MISLVSSKVLKTHFQDWIKGTSRERRRRRLIGFSKRPSSGSENVRKLKITVLWCSLFIVATSQETGDRANWWSCWTITNSFFYQPIPDFPRKNTLVFLLVIFDAILYFWRGDSGLWSPNYSWTDTSRFLIFRAREMKFICSHSIYSFSFTW